MNVWEDLILQPWDFCRGFSIYRRRFDGHAAHIVGLDFKSNRQRVKLVDDNHCVPRVGSPRVRRSSCLCRRVARVNYVLNENTAAGDCSGLPSLRIAGIVEGVWGKVRCEERRVDAEHRVIHVSLQQTSLWLESLHMGMNDRIGLVYR